MKSQDFYWNLFIKSGNPGVYLEYRRELTQESEQISASNSTNNIENKITHEYF